MIKWQFVSAIFTLRSLDSWLAGCSGIYFLYILCSLFQINEIQLYRGMLESKH